MTTYNVSKNFLWHDEISQKSAMVMRMFGLTADQLNERSVTHNCQLEIESGDVVYITGPSGAGKSVLLREIEKAVPKPQRINLGQIELPSVKAVIDYIEGDFLQSLKLLSTAGLSGVFSMLNRPANLSDGQKWRFRLAMALAAKKDFVFADEFCTNLDYVTASVIAYNIRKFAKRNNTTFVLAASHDRFLADLQPDVLITKDFSGPANVVYKNRRNQR